MMRLVNTIVSMLILVAVLQGCQQDAEIVILPSSTDAISADSAAINLIVQTSLYDGSFDNIIDHTSCSAVVLPVTVVVDGQEIVVKTQDDYKLIERKCDESNVDSDSIEIFFPITVKLADHSERIIHNDGELKSLANHCHEDGMDDDIECIDFIYPINFSVYNPSNQTGSVVSVNTDSALYEFMKRPGPGLLASIIFPVRMQLSDSVILVINNNGEMKNAISHAKGSCDEDDDNDYEDDDINSADFLAVLLGSSWKVNSFIDRDDETSNFVAYSFAFSADGKVVASNGTTTVQGVWTLYNDSNPLELRIEFNVDSHSPFDQLKDNWKVHDYNNSAIILKDHEHDDHAKVLSFGKL